MIKGYSLIDLKGKSVIVKDGIDAKIKKVDTIIFDCDGVLIDAKESYDVAIKMAVDFLINAYFKGIDFTLASDEQIESLRLCGGFNNDWDTTYILSEWAFLSMPKDGIRSFHEAFKRAKGLDLKGIVESLSSNAYTLKESIDIESSRSSFLRKLERLRASYGFVDRDAVDRILIDAMAKDGDVVDELISFREYVGYPGRFGESLLVTIFDELFYGKDGIASIYGSEPLFNMGDGLFKKDMVIVEEVCLSMLERIVGKQNMAIVSGRDSWTVSMILGDLLRYFNQRASVFLADEVRIIGLDALAVGKPDPYCLMKSISYIQPRGQIVYVGDSAEDLEMVKRSKSMGREFIFVGVYEGSRSPEGRLRYFLENGADLVLPNVNLLPDLMMHFGVERWLGKQE